MSNWINFEINGKKYYLLVKLNENNDFDCLLYDGNESWYEKQMLETILARAKEQNRRIQFDETTIKETLQSGQPTEVTLLSDDTDEVDEESLRTRLKLKYSVKSCPFHFNWHLEKQSEHDFQKFILFPLFRIVQGLTQQNKELREIINKKDVEIKQYKYEFGNIKRVTVSTKPFNTVNFDERFAETLELSKCMMQISDLLKAQYSQMKTPLKAKAVDKEDDDLASKSKEDVKLTPRRKRRKIFEEQRRIIIEKMQSLNKPFAYESSQSQASSISQSDTDVASTSRRLLRSPKKSNEPKIENDLDETPTKRNRIQKPASNQSPVESLKTNLKSVIEYDSNSDDEVKNNKLNDKKLSQIEDKSMEKVSNEARTSSPLTRNRASEAVAQKSPESLSTISTDKNVAAAALLTRRNVNVYDYNESSDDGKDIVKSPNKTSSQLAKQTNTTNVSASSLNKPSCSAVEKSPAKSVKNTTAGRLTRKNAGIEFEDSSESPAEEIPFDKSKSSLNTSPTKNSNFKITQSPEQLSDDVQNLIDEWKALEKRRLADLKIRQK